MAVIIDEVWIDDVVYYYVEAEVEYVPIPLEETTCGGFFENGPTASLTKEYALGRCYSILKLKVKG